jgi:hypothetical protein
MKQVRMLKTNPEKNTRSTRFIFDFTQAPLVGNLLFGSFRVQ